MVVAVGMGSELRLRNNVCPIARDEGARIILKLKLEALADCYNHGESKVRAWTIDREGLLPVWKIQ